MNRLNKKGDLMTFIVPLIVVLVIGVIIILFNQNTLGTVSDAFRSTDFVLKSAAAGCSPSMATGDLQQAFCSINSVIKKGGIFSLSSHYVSCEYLNNTLNVPIPGIEEYNTRGPNGGAITCNRDDAFRKKCELLLAENDGDTNYKALVNGRVCNSAAVSTTP